MTERLSDLMRRAVDDLPVPPAPPSAEVVRHGRAMRRRRRVATVAGAAALVVVAVGVGAAVRPGDGDDRGAPDRLADRAGGLTGPVFAVGTIVYLDGGARSAVIEDRALKSMYYTSAGVLVRHGNNPYSDGGGPMRFSLVAPDASVTPLDVTFEETVPSTDPDQPYLAYAEVVDDVVQVVVLDVRDGSEVARVPVPDAKEWGGWTAPPVSLDGDLVYVGTDDTARVVDWRTGEVSTTDAIGPGFPDVRAGHAISDDGRRSVVVDVSDGRVLATSEKDEFLRLSPDGRYVVAQSYLGNSPSTRLVDLDTGRSTALHLAGNGLGWSPDDQVFTVEKDVLTSCGASTGECTTSRLQLPATPDKDQKSFDDDLKLGGATYES